MRYVDRVGVALKPRIRYSCAMVSAGGSGATLRATLWFVLLAVASTAPALLGNRSLGPESLLDVDPLYSTGGKLRYPRIFDPTRTYQDLPRDFAIADGFAHGRVDLWNPRVGLGMPLWAEGGAPFLPLKLPFYIAPSRRTYDLATALRLIVAGLGAYLLARRRGLAAVPALAAGSLFELSGAIMAGLPFGFAAPPCFLPWALLGADAIARRRTLAAAAAAGVVLGVTASSGHPMFAVVVFAGFGAAIAGHGLAAWRSPRTVVAVGGLACVAVMLGLAIAATALLPLLEVLSVGRLYKETMTYDVQSGQFLHRSWHTLSLALFAPATLAAMREGLPGGFPYALAPAIGLTGLVLAVAGMLRRGLDAALVAVVVLGIGMAIAPPGLSSVRQLPLLQYVYSIYSWPLVALPLTQAAGRGVAALADRRERRSLFAALGLVLLGTVSLFFVQDYGAAPPYALPVRRVFLRAISDNAGWLRLVAPPVLVATVFVVMTVIVPTARAAQCAVVATALAACELGVSVAPAVWFRDTSVLTSPPSPALQFLTQQMTAADRMLGVPREVGHPATPSLFGLADVRGVAALPVERYVRYLRLISPIAHWYVWQDTGGVMVHPLLDLAAVRYLVVKGSAGTPELERDPAVRPAYRDYRAAIYENAAALPRARVVHAAIAVRDADEAAASLAAAAARGAHAAEVGLADQILVEPGADGQAPPAAPGGVVMPGEEVTIVADDDPDRVTLQASLTTPGYVVLADTYYPGWTASIDGTPTPIHPADLLFRAVFVPAGQHTIVFRYNSPVFTAALVLTALGGGLSVMLLIRGRRVGRDSEH